MSETPTVDAATRTEIEAAVFQKLLGHLQKHPEVQNIDLMNLGYFCRNCLSKWYRTESEKRGVSLDYDQARETIYGMPYAEYKAAHQEKASPDKLEAFAEAEKKATT